MRQTVGSGVGVKAAGGIRSYTDALNMIAAEANRIGASASVKIMLEAEQAQTAQGQSMRTCPNCRTGSMQARTTTYANWHAGQYVTVPNMPAWSCDVCALCQIDSEALRRLLPLLGPVTHPDPTQVRRASEKRQTVGELTYEDAEPDQDRRST